MIPVSVDLGTAYCMHCGILNSINSSFISSLCWALFTAFNTGLSISWLMGTSPSSSKRMLTHFLVTSCSTRKVWQLEDQILSSPRFWLVVHLRLLLHVVLVELKADMSRGPVRVEHVEHLVLHGLLGLLVLPLLHRCHVKLHHGGIHLIKGVCGKGM